jgi:hypothetical protein
MGPVSRMRKELVPAGALNVGKARAGCAISGGCRSPCAPLPIGRAVLKLARQGRHERAGGPVPVQSSWGLVGVHGNPRRSLRRSWAQHRAEQRGRVAAAPPPWLIPEVGNPCTNNTPQLPFLLCSARPPLPSRPVGTVFCSSDPWPFGQVLCYNLGRMHIPALRRQLQRWWRGTPPAGGTAPASGGPRFKPLSREQLRR